MKIIKSSAVKCIFSKGSFKFKKIPAGKENKSVSKLIRQGRYKNMDFDVTIDKIVYISRIELTFPKTE